MLLGLVLPLVVAVGVLARLSLGPFSGLWYGFLLVTGHHVGLYSTVLGAVLLTCFAAAVRITLARRRPARPEPQARPRLYLQH